MKKLFIISLIALSTLSYGRVVSRPRPVSRPKVSSTRSYSKPKVVRIKPSTKTITHKAAIKPKTTSFSSTSTIKPKTSSSLISTTPKPTTVKKSLFNDSNDNYNSFSSSGSSYSSSSNYHNNNSSSFGLFDFLLLNSLMNNSNNSKTIIRDEHGNELDEKQIIEILEKEIKEEKNKFEPNKEKIKQYEELIKKLKCD